MRGVALSLPSRRRTGIVCLAAVSLHALAFAPPVAAQAVSNGAEANELVQVVKSSLMGIAIALLVLTIFYWIHTDPKRRARAHSKKELRSVAFENSRSAEMGVPSDDSETADVVMLGDHAEVDANGSVEGASAVDEREVS